MGAYSPQEQSGGILHFPSPTHIHHVDPTSAFRQLRRSLSRSPSKVSAFRLVTSKSTSPTPASPLSPPRASTPIRSFSENLLSPSPANTPNGANARRTRQSSRKLSPLRHASRPSSTPRSPRKRTLQESANQGNAVPSSSADSCEDQENRRRSPTPGGDPMQDVAFKISETIPHSSPFAPPRATSRFERGYNSWSAKSSPLKRSDGTMERDQGHGTSPSAKRRSLHGGIFGPDFDVFDQATGCMESQIDTKMMNSPCDNDRTSIRETSSPFLGRSSSLRKTTLQQRQDKPSVPRTKLHADPVFEFSSPAQSISKNRARLSFEGTAPSLPRDSPFSSQGNLPNASIHPMFQPGKAIDPRLSCKPQRHPLSRTISQSTSASSLAEDSPTHVPVRQPEQRRHYIDFSKSLPIGADRPSAENSQADSQSSNFSFETPVNYKLVKPLPAAFMSTGLISKKHKNPITSQPNFGASTSTMPDTPCKRHSLAEFPSPSRPQAEFSVKPEQKRHSFGTPPTPSDQKPLGVTPANFGLEFGIFGNSNSKVRLDRSSSFLSIDGEDNSQSPSRHFDSQSSAEFEIPPTPTRHFGGSHQGQSTSRKEVLTRPDGDFRSPSAAILFNSSAVDMHRQSTCKYTSHSGGKGTADEDSDDKMNDSPSVGLRFRSFSSFQRSFTHSRLLRNSKSPTPLNRASFSTPALLARRSLAKRSPLSPASPPDSQEYHLSPRTPKDNVIPPDPSGLSISQHGDHQGQSIDKVTSASSMFPPATPTASREYFSRSGIGATPSHLAAPVEVDPILTSRFDRAELIGSGEFSQVYRVSRKQELRTSGSYFSMPMAHRSPKTHMPDRVWAVKRTRNAYIGPKDRQRKLREVEVLKALGQSEHTLQMIDSWEHRNRLYIQTEFCEEGSLDVFLEKQGSRARLDDFRIWKILLELSLVSNSCLSPY